ncbi:MAG: flagellar hook protein FlgE [Bacteroidota bacterium]
MIRSLRTGITGLRSNQLRLDVIGNNIAGVNTAGFKRSRVLFQDALAQRIGTGGSLYGDATRNPSNVGYGVTVGAIDRVWSQGAFEYTDLPTDLAIAGDGFFIAESQRGPVLTRLGAFSFDAEGHLVTSGGLRVQGWEATVNGEIVPGALTDIRLDPTASTPPVVTSSMTIEGNFAADREVGDAPIALSSVIYDGTGTPHTLVLTGEKTATGEWTLTGAELAGDPPTPLAIPTDGTEVITFGPDGIQTSAGLVAVTGAFPDGSPLAIDFDFSALTQYAGSTTAAVTAQDGSAGGELVDYGFDQEGRLILAFSNGERRVAAQVALGSVANPDGLEQVGDGFYSASVASGELQVGRAGNEIPAGVVAGALEASNVDLAEEFTDMIVAQRGYQANARVVTTSDELLQETVQLKR